MSTHELVLLSPYRYPAGHAMTLADEDMACWLQGLTALWHPAALWQAQGPPRCDAPYDHEQPRPGCLYALPETPSAYLPEDWDERVRAAGSVVFRATTDRATTLANLRAALAESPLGWGAGLELPQEKVGPFFGLGLGHLLQAALAEAMEHENLLDPSAFWGDVQFAIALLAGFAYTPVETGVTAATADPYPTGGLPPEEVGYEESPPPAPEVANGPAAP